MDAASSTSTHSERTPDSSILDASQMEALVESVARQVASKLLLESKSNRDDAAAVSRDIQDIAKETVAEMKKNDSGKTGDQQESPAEPSRREEEPASKSLGPDRLKDDSSANNANNTVAGRPLPSSVLHDECDGVGHDDLMDANFWNADFLQVTAQLDNLASSKTFFSLRHCRQMSEYMDAQERRHEEREAHQRDTSEPMADNNNDNASAASDVSGLTGVGTTLLVEPSSSRRTRTVHFTDKVHFSTVTVREYSPMLDDNPGCASSGGPTLSIDWDYQEMDPLPVDIYESKRPKRRRTMVPLDRKRRTKRVQAWGYSPVEIAAAVRSVNKIQHQRRQTINNLHVQGVEEAVEKVRKKVQKVFQRRRRNNQSKMYASLEDGSDDNSWNASRHSATSRSTTASSLRSPKVARPVDSGPFKIEI